MKFAKIVFASAAIWGFLVLPPMYLMERSIGRNTPPPITHPEFFYGFIGVAVAFQVVFLITARDPVRYRPMMIPSIIEKFSFAIPCSLLFATQRISQQMFFAGMVDLLLGVLFVTAYLKLRQITEPSCRQIRTP